MIHQPECAEDSQGMQFLTRDVTVAINNKENKRNNNVPAKCPYKNVPTRTSIYSNLDLLSGDESHGRTQKKDTQKTSPSK